MSSCRIYHFHADPIPKGFSFFDIGKHTDYFKPSEKINIPKQSLFDLLKTNKKLKVSCYFSGSFLNQISKEKQLINPIRDAVKHGRIELLAGSFYYTLSSLFSAELFEQEVEKHRNLLNELFEYSPKGFINTIGIFSNDISDPLINMGFEFAVVPKVQWFQGSHKQSSVFKSKNEKLWLLLMEVPKEEGASVTINGGLDTMPNEQAVDSLTCHDFITQNKESNVYNLPNLVALDSEGNDLTHYLGNALQKQIFKKLNDLAPYVFKSKDPTITEHFLQLGSAEQFKKMGQKVQSEIRYHHYNWMINCLTDLELKLL